MSASVFIQIVARNIFSRSFENFEELPRFLLIWVTFLGAAVVFREAGHLGVEFFVNLLPKKIKYYAMILSNIFNTLFILLLIFVGGEIAMLTMVQLRVPVGLVYMVIPISGVIMLLVLVERLIDLYQTKQTIDT
jgi:TRAP-type C4-dicarboxylate transport system permease small subunit